MHYEILDTDVGQGAGAVAVPVTYGKMVERTDICQPYSVTEVLQNIFHADFQAVLENYVRTETEQIQAAGVLPGAEGIMEASDSTEYDTSELEEFEDELFSAIETLNPYPQKLDALAYESKGAEEFVADFPCEQCGKFGVSVNEAFMTIGRCCYCGYEHELVRCERCDELVSEDVLEHGFCPSCAAYIDKQ